MGKRIVRVDIDLVDVEPPVRRTLEMYSTSTLGELHLAIQDVMPWEERHLHRFLVDESTYYVDPLHGWEEDLVGDDEYRDQDTATLGAMMRAGLSRFEYQYDLGDHWVHDVELSLAGSEDEGVAYPRVVEGTRACPLEDSGGPRGHRVIVEALRGTPRSDVGEEEREQLRRWAGEYDPESFDVAEAQARLDVTFGDRPARPGPWDDRLETFRLGGPVPTRGRARAGRAHVGASLVRDLPAERFEGARFIRDAAKMLRMLEDEPAPLTRSGNLSVASVVRSCEALGIRLDPHQPIRSEDDVPAIKELRTVLEVAGLLRRRGGVEALTPRGKLLVDPARRAELAATLMRTRFEEYNIAYLTPGGDAPRLQHLYLEVLARLREVARGWVSATDIWRDALPSPVITECVTALRRRPTWLVEYRLLRPFVEMGLLEKGDPDDSAGESRYRVTPLLDEWVRFDEVEPFDPVRLRGHDGPPVRVALERFLEEVAAGLPARTSSAFRWNAELLASYLDGYGANDLPAGVREAWESAKDMMPETTDEEPPRFCDVFGVEYVPDAIVTFLRWFLPRKVGVSEDGAVKAARFADELLRWLSREGMVADEDMAVAVEHAESSRTSLPAAARFKRLMDDWCDRSAPADEEELVEGEFMIVRVEADALWLEATLDPDRFGASPVPAEVAEVARVGMEFSGALVPERGVWRIAEVWTVYPD